MKQKNVPIRMCIVCKSRFPQSDLFRFQVKSLESYDFTKQCRSFYICKICIDKDKKKLQKALQRYAKIPEAFMRKN